MNAEALIGIVSGFVAIIAGIFAIRHYMRQSANPISIHAYPYGFDNGEKSRNVIVVKITNSSATAQAEITDTMYSYENQGIPIHSWSETDEDGLPIVDGYLDGTIIAPGTTVRGVIMEDLSDYILKGTYIAKNEDGEDWEFIDEDVTPSERRHIEVGTPIGNAETYIDVPEDFQQCTDEEA